MRSATSPLWAMMLSLADPPTLARGLSLLADLGTAVVVVRTFTPWGAALWTAFWCSPFMLGSAVSGLETHLVADALVCSLRYPIGLALACLRPDACILALTAAGNRWKWALAGTAVMLGANLVLARHLIPQTLGSKLATYGVHWFRGWYWFRSEGLGWLELPLIAAAVWAGWRTRWWYLAAALGPLLAYWALGVPNFYWYAVPSAGLLAALACEKLSRGGFVIGFAVLALCWPGQWDRIHAREIQQYWLMNMAQCLKSLHPMGTILLEPAGIIPYVNPGLRVVDDVGLTDPWLAQRRNGPPGWLTDAVLRYRPEWIVSRVVELESGKAFAGKGEPFRSSAERDSLLAHYWLGCTTGVRFLGDRIRGRNRADVMVILQTSPVPVPRE